MLSPNSREGLPEPVVDTTITSMPEWVLSAYPAMNARIASEREQYGHTIQYPHLVTSRAAIAATARVALGRSRAGEDRNAIILGPGGCFDIPLEEIATEFDETTLVDVDTTQTERALSDLPARVLGRISLIKADITGRVAELGSIFDRVRELKYSDFIRVATVAVNGLAQQQTAKVVSGEYSFTCSQLLMTQLSSIPFLRFSTHVREAYGTPLSMQPGMADEPLIYALNEYNSRAQVAHVQQLAQLAKPRGTVHFADTVAEVQQGQLLPMASMAPFEEMGRHFIELTPGTTWHWDSKPGRQFVVLAQSLVPKPVEAS